MGKRAKPILSVLTMGVIDKFWSKVKCRGADECWPWMGAKNSYGYGAYWFRCPNTGIGRYFLAHRVAWALTHGEPDRDLVVRHQCHSKWCCNPNHLRLGTIQENNLDMRRARRSLHGSRNPRSALSEDQAREILGLKGCGITAVDLAKRYQVSSTSIRSIWNGTTWIYLEPLAPPRSRQSA